MPITYSIDELQEARRSLTSTIAKCEKALAGIGDAKSQRTLLVRRIKALRIAVDLIEEKLESQD